MTEDLIVWASADPDYKTGYGRQTAIWTSKMRDEGYNVEIASMGGLKGVPREWNGIKVWPVGDFFDLAQLYVRRDAKLLIGLRDVWTINSAIFAEANIRCAFWTPIDCDPMSIADLAHLRASRAYPIAMSRFGGRMLRKAGFEQFQYVPHGIDTTYWTPSADTEMARIRANIPADVFVIGINATNFDAQRKGWYEQLEAFARFHAEHPNTALLVHTLLNDEGTNLEYVIHLLGIEDVVGAVDQWMYKQGLISDNILREWYRTLHVLSNCSWGEGFGIPIVEAQACGVPAIVTDCSSMPELVENGWLVPGERKWNATHNGRWVAPNIDEIRSAYEEAYQMWATDKSRWHAFTTQARKSAQRYSIDRVWKRYWRPALSAIFRGRTMIFENAGLRWKVDVDVTSGDGIGPQHEDSVEQVLLSLIPKGGVFLDVGAHVGHYSLRASKVAGKVIAIEPNPETIKRLKENIELNEIYNIAVHEIAAWDKGEPLGMTSPNDAIRDGSMRALPVAEVRAGWHVDGRPLDNVLKDEPRIDVIKLDVEGADLHALRGMRELITKHRPVMFIEDHSIYDYYKREDLLALIEELDYGWIDGGTYGGANYFICRPR